MATFKLVSNMKPSGDQPQAIENLTKRILDKEKYSTLLGVTGSGKTFTMANTIANIGKPTLVISHNKTLAAQLYSEFKEFFPENAVHYFVSYYDYYQPEAYIPQRDIYIEKDVDINEDIDRLRLAATSALMSRDDVIIVASVSSIYGLGSPDDYSRMVVELKKGDTYDRKKLFKQLVDIQYERTNEPIIRGKFRVTGDIVHIYPSYEETGLRIEFFGDTIEKLAITEPVSGEVKKVLETFTIYPAKHFVMPEDRIRPALENIRTELNERLIYLKKEGKVVEAHRLEARTKYDLELMEEVGYCKGIENYSRHLAGRKEGEPPYTLLDYYATKDIRNGGRDFLVFVDESHVTAPQIRGMYNGDRARKTTLIEYGFRLPSALDNRPLTFEEWESKAPQIVFVSATPAPFELNACGGKVIEQIIRPTGLVDPHIRVEPATNQVKDLLGEIKKRVADKERVLVTTLTKRLAEMLSSYLQEEGIKGRYLHSEIHTIERVEILKELREGKIDVLVGVNLLREGLDLPEVTLVAILDADKEGFLRSETSIIQTVGRTARNVNGAVILYADKITDSMKRAMLETERRRKIQLAYNEKHNITPKTIEKEIRKGIEEIIRAERVAKAVVNLNDSEFDRVEKISLLTKEMYQAANDLDFERAATLRDLIRELSGDNEKPKRIPKRITASRRH